MKALFSISLLFISMSIFADGRHRKDDTLHLYRNVDTTYIMNFRDMLNAKLICVVRTNKFSVTETLSQSKLEYSINTNANMGIGMSFKGIGFEFQYNPPGLNTDDDKFGASKQISFATNANGRRFIYDVFYRYNQGYHTTTTYKVPVPNDTTFTYEYLYRPDIKNTNLGAELVYVFNNKRFSSSAPYNLTQKQRKSAGSLLLGTFASLYAIDADSVIFPDSLKDNFTQAVQFKSAGSITWGISCGYTYTLIFGRNWFVNLYTLPGLAVQQFYSTNAYDQQTHSNASIGLSLQTRFSIGYNKRNYFIGISWMNTQYFVDNDKKSSLNYKNGCFRFYYGHRFDLRKMLKKRF